MAKNKVAPFVPDTVYILYAVWSPFLLDSDSDSGVRKFRTPDSDTDSGPKNPGLKLPLSL